MATVKGYATNQKNKSKVHKRDVAHAVLTPIAWSMRIWPSIGAGLQRIKELQGKYCRTVGCCMYSGDVGERRDG